VVASVFASELRAVAESAADARLRACVSLHARAVWRVLRRNGVPEADADDGVQKVFLVLARKIEEVLPERELGFLLRTATFVASESRRTQRRRHEVDGPIHDVHESKELRPDDAVAQRQAVERLDAILDAMEEPLRAVFVLYELEEMTMAAIAETLEVPMGTVASRLRRARVRFEELCGGHT
jgi:RNA polymerase sigma-70 factor (ECF subfamily)